MRAKDAPRKTAPAAYKRYARLPADAAVKDALHDWQRMYCWDAAFAGLMPEMERGAQLVLGTYGAKRYALMYLVKPTEPGWPNAVTGWGESVNDALVQLSFKWLALMQETWEPTKHAQLVTEGGVRR